MAWWGSHKPRGFRHTYLYIDERSELIASLRSRQQTGDETSGDATASGHRRLSLLAAARESQRQRRSHVRLLAGILVPLLMLALLIAVSLVLF